MQTIADINEEYFGKEKSKNYLKHDFSSVLYGLVQRSVIIDVLAESSKARHNEKKHIDKKGNESISRGDFDPDNAGFLWSVYESYQKGVMVDVRQLLTPNETGTGGKFINDIAKLNVEAFMNYYKTPRAYTVPPMLFAKYLETKRENDSLSIVDFVDAHHAEIEAVVNQLIKSVVDFQSKGYFNQIVKDYQALKFHKDNRPEKYDVTEVIEDLGV